MRITVKELVHRKRNELHENVTVPKDQFNQERDRLISVSATSSSPDQP
jgi:post-segregation antitoxin (ccd killing protein)